MIKMDCECGNEIKHQLILDEPRNICSDCFIKHVYATMVAI